MTRLPSTSNIPSCATVISTVQQPRGDSWIHLGLQFLPVNSTKGPRDKEVWSISKIALKQWTLESKLERKLDRATCCTGECRRGKALADEFIIHSSSSRLVKSPQKLQRNFTDFKSSCSSVVHEFTNVTLVTALAIKLPWFEGKKKSAGCELGELLDLNFLKNQISSNLSYQDVQL